jgi:hypothetical protein
VSIRPNRKVFTAQPRGPSFAFIEWIAWFRLEY